MTPLLNSVGAVISLLISVIGDLLNLFATQPVLQIFLALAVVSAVIGMISTLLNRGRGHSDDY